MDSQGQLRNWKQLGFQRMILVPPKKELYENQGFLEMTGPLPGGR